jgi:hypothetical protein
MDNGTVIQATTKEKVVTAVKYWASNIIVAIICIVYILKDFASIVVTGKSLWEIVAYAFIALTTGFMVSVLRSEKGISDAKSSNKFTGTLDMYGEAKKGIEPCIESVAMFCEEKNKSELKNVQIHILSKAGLSYETFKQWQEGNEIIGIKDNTPLAKLRRKCLTEASRVKIYRLTTQALLSDENKYKGDTYLGEDISTYRLKDRAMDISTRWVFALVGAYFGLSLLIDGISWGTVLWACFQVAIFLVQGQMRYTNSYNFIEDKYRNRLIRKSFLLKECKAWSERRKANGVQN